MTALLLAVDVGAQAARAGAFDDTGRLVARGEYPLDLIRPAAGEAVYRRDAVWHAVCAAIRACLAGDGTLGMRVVGLGFAATGGVVLDYTGAPPLGGGGDVFSSMDQRAAGDAAEAHLRRLSWLKQHAPEAWARVTAVRDLVDEMALRATGNDRHGLAALAARWPYRAGAADPWQHERLAAAGLEEVWGMGALAGDPVLPGQVQGLLLGDVAAYLGLPPGIPVGAGLLDSQAGLLGTMGRNAKLRVGHSAALIGGMAAPLLALSTAAREIPGVGGPYAETVLPGLSLYEAHHDGGAALDLVLETHPGGPQDANEAGHLAVAREVLALLDREGAAFAADFHVVPEDIDLPALMTGPRTGRSRRGFRETYYAVARGLALRTRETVAHLNAHGFAIERVTLAGGQARNPLMARLYRDALGCDLVISAHPEPVLLGTAMAAAVASGVFPSLPVAIDVMAPAQARLVADPYWRRVQGAAYGIYRDLAAAREAAAAAGRALAAMGR